MAAELNDRGFVCSIPRVERIMKAHHIRSTIKTRFKKTTNSDHKKEWLFRSNRTPIPGAFGQFLIVLFSQYEITSKCPNGEVNF